MLPLVHAALAPWILDFSISRAAVTAFCGLSAAAEPLQKQPRVRNLLLCLSLNERCPQAPACPRPCLSHRGLSLVPVPASHTEGSALSSHFLFAPGKGSDVSHTLISRCSCRSSSGCVTAFTKLLSLAREQPQFVVSHLRAQLLLCSDLVLPR